MFFSQSSAHQGQPINEFAGYALSHSGKATAEDNVYDPAKGPDAYTNARVHGKLTQYTEAAKKRYGDEFDPATEPLDTDLVMRLGGGKQHGRYWMANSAIDPSSVRRLSEIRSRSTTSSDIPIAPRQQSNTQMMEAFQVITVSFVVHWFYTCALPMHCFNVTCVILQARMVQLEARQAAQAAEFEAKQAAQAEAHRRELEAYQQHAVRQMQDVAAYFGGLQIPGVTLPPLPTSLFAPPPFPVPNPIGTPVSICSSLFLCLVRLSCRY